MNATIGTKTAAWMNLGGAILTALPIGDLSTLVGGTVAPWLPTILLFANAILHSTTGNAPMIGAKS